MTDLRTAAQQALEALEMHVPQYLKDRGYPPITALKAALAEPVEPVAWMVYTEGGTSAYVTDNPNDLVGAYRALPLYPAPPQRTAEPVQEPVAWTYEWKHRLHGGSLNVSRARWPESDLWIETPLYATPSQRKPLTEEEIDNIWGSEKAFADIYAIARAIERAHGITP